MLKDRHLSSSLQNRFSWFHNLYKIVGLSIFLYMQINVHVRVQSLVSLLQIWLCALCEFLFSFKENMNKSISLLSKLIPMAKCLLYFQSCCQILNYSAENFFIIPQNCLKCIQRKKKNQVLGVNDSSISRYDLVKCGVHLFWIDDITLPFRCIGNLWQCNQSQ